MSNNINENYNILRKKLKPLTNELNNILFDSPSKLEKYTFKITEIFKNNNINFEIKGICCVDHFRFLDSKIQVDIYMEDLGFCYCINRLKLFINDINVTFAEGPWYDHVINIIIPAIIKSIKEMNDFIDNEALIKKEDYKQKIEFLRKNF